MTNKTTLNKSNLKQVLISILIGAAVTFLSTIFESLANLLKTHSTEVISGVVSVGAYLAKTYNA